MQKEKEQQDKLNAVKARLLYGDESGRNPRNHEESHYSKSKTPTARTEPRKKHRSKHSRSPSPIVSVFRRLRRNRPPSPGPRPQKEGGVFSRLGEKNKAHPHVLTAVTVPTRREPKCNQGSIVTGAHRPEPWTCEERNPFTPRIRHFDFPRTRMPSHVKTYDGSGDPEDHLKLFQSAAKTERWAMPTWCHMFNSTLTGNARVWFDKLPKESIDSYEDLRAAFRENYLQQTKHIKDPVEIHHIKQRNGESTKDFMERYKAEVLDVEGALECMKISGFMHGITHPELIKRLYEKIPRSMDEMYRVTTSFLQGEVAAFSHSRKKAPAPWRQPEEGNKPNFKKGFKNKQRSDRKPDRFSLLTKTPKEIFALEKGKFKAPPPMVTPVEKRDPNKYCEFHADTGHSTDECMQLRKQIDEMIKSGEEDGTEGPMIIEAEIGGHFVHRIYVDGGASSEVLYEHCFVRLRPEIRSQMIPATTSLIGFSGETIWPIGQISLLVKIGGEEHSTSAWMNFMVIRSPSQHNRIIGRTGIHGTRNVKIPSQKRNGDDTKQQSHPDGIHRIYPNRKGTQRTMCFAQTKPGCFCLEASRHDGRPAAHSGAPPKCPRRMPTYQTKEKGQAPERNKAIQEEVEKLVDAGIMKEVHYHSWLSNPVMVKKHDGSWRICGPQLRLRDVLKDVQKLNGNLGKLKTRFLSKQAEKITAVLQNPKEVHKDEAISNGLMGEVRTAAKEAISAVLMTERGGKQLPVYFVSRALRGPEINYTPMEKLVLALLSASRRLKRYFQAHTIVVITDQPIKQLLSKSEISGRMLKWKFELEGYDIQYRPRTSIKGQILADFIVERPDEESPDELMAEPEELPEPWTLFTDGSSCIDGSGAGLILTNPKGVEFTYAMRFRFEATNNEAEYEALIAGLRIAEQMGIKNLQANVDSRLVANQVNGSYVAKESGMVQYLEKVKTLASNFKEFSIKQVPRSENKKADALSKIASTSFAHLSKQVLVEELKEKSIHEKEVLAIVEEEGQTWMTPICEYLTKEILPEDKKKARVVRRKASRYIMINGTLYKKSFLGPWLRFGLPGEIVSDNGKQFRDNPFKDWCEKLCIRQCFASVKHPQANGLVERANRSLGEGIKARLDERSKNWI
ncbi:reverse transcriptase domain-containing protein [Tanacetum coccineum]